MLHGCSQWYPSRDPSRYLVRQYSIQYLFELGFRSCIQYVPDIQLPMMSSGQHSWHHFGQYVSVRYARADVSKKVTE